MVKEIWVNIGSGNGSLSDGTKPLAELKFPSHLWGSMTFTLDQSSSEPPRCYSVSWVWKLYFQITATSLKANELKNMPTFAGKKVEPMISLSAKIWGFHNQQLKLQSQPLSADASFWQYDALWSMVPAATCCFVIAAAAAV